MNRGNGNHNRDVRIVNWPHFHGIGKARKKHQHIYDVRDEKHIAAVSVDHFGEDSSGS